MTLALSVPLSPKSVRAHGYFGSGGPPQERCCQLTVRLSYSKVADWVSEIFDLPPLSTKIPPVELTRLGHPSPSIQRVVSSMWTHMSPTMPLPYSVNVRHTACA